MAEVEPLLLHEDLESLLSPVVRVQQELGQSQQLRGPVPPVATVNYHGTSLRLRKLESQRGRCHICTKYKNNKKIYFLMSRTGTLGREMNEIHYQPNIQENLKSK